MKQISKNFFNLKNKIIVITGGSGFLGSEFSSTLSDVGAIPIILDKNEASLELFDTFKPESDFHPNWGRERAEQVLAECKE